MRIHRLLATLILVLFLVSLQITPGVYAQEGLPSDGTGFEYNTGAKNFEWEVTEATGSWGTILEVSSGDKVKYEISDSFKGKTSEEILDICVALFLDGDNIDLMELI